MDQTFQVGIGSHCGQFDVDLLVDFVDTGETLGWGELVLVTELSRGEVVVLSDGRVLSLTSHHQGGYPTVQEMFQIHSGTELKGPRVGDIID